MISKAENIARECLFHTEGKAFCTYLPWQDALGVKESTSYGNPAWFLWMRDTWRQHPLRDADWWLDDWWKYCPDPIARSFLLSRKAVVRKMFTALLMIPFPLLAADPGFPVITPLGSRTVKDWRHDPSFAFRQTPGYAASVPDAAEMEAILSAAKTWAREYVAAENGYFTPMEEILVSLREWLALSRPLVSISNHNLQRLLPWILSGKKKTVFGEHGYEVRVFRQGYFRDSGTGAEA